MNEFDEQSLVSTMRAHLPEEIKDKYPDDELLNIIDIVWDYYEDNGLLDVDADDDDDNLDMDSLIAHTAKMIVKDRGTVIVPVDVAALVRAEVEAENELFDLE